MEVVHTEQLEPARRFAAWVELIRSACGPLDLDVSRPHKNGFDGHLHVRRLGEVYVGVVTADPHTVARTCPGSGHCDGEGLYLCGLSAGEMAVTQDGRQTTARAEELVCFDNTRAYTLRMPERFSMVALMLPHRTVGLSPLATAALTAMPWPADRGVAALLWQVVISLGQHLGELNDDSTRQLGTGVASLTNTLFTERLRVHTDAPDAVRQALVLRIQVYARDHLGDPRLDSTMLARHHNISVRYLQKLFQEQGLSPASWLRDERLANCRAELRDPRLAHLTVAAIGERSGLPGTSHFSRIFRERYGVTPHEFRRYGRSSPAEGRSDDVGTGQSESAVTAVNQPRPRAAKVPHMSLTFARLDGRRPEPVTGG